MRNWSENQIAVHLVWIRHGATESIRKRRYLGREDESLCPEGIRRLMKDSRAGRYPAVDLLVSSPMKRCLETAAILYPDSKPLVIPEWEEMDFGAFSGRTYEELKGDPRYQAWIDSGGTLPFPEGEGRAEFEERCRCGFSSMLDQLFSGDSGRLEALELWPERSGSLTVGLVVHGGIIMSLASRYGGGGYYDYQVQNGDGYRCTLLRRGEEIRFFDIRRLGEETGQRTTQETGV